MSTLLFVPIAEIDNLFTAAATPAHALTMMSAGAAVEQLGMFEGEGAQLLTVEAASDTVTCPVCRRSAPRPRRGRLYCNGIQFNEVK